MSLERLEQGKALFIEAFPTILKASIPREITIIDTEVSNSLIKFTFGIDSDILFDDEYLGYRKKLSSEINSFAEQNNLLTRIVFLTKKSRTFSIDIEIKLKKKKPNKLDKPEFTLDKFNEAFMYSMRDLSEKFKTHISIKSLGMDGNLFTAQLKIDVESGQYIEVNIAGSPYKVLRSVFDEAQKLTSKTEKIAFILDNQKTIKIQFQEVT